MSRRLAVLGLTVSLVVPVTSAPAAAAPVAVAPAPPAGAVEVGAIESALPPGARQLLGVLRIFKGLGRRNRVYREARGVQGDLREFYDAQIATAQRQLAEREQLGLHESQVRAYVRVVEKLRAERDAAIGITEDEKRAAKYGFESKLQRELTTAILQIPRVRAGLEKAKEAIDDLKGAFRQARAALEGGNPITDLVGEMREKLDKVDRYAELGSVLSGDVGRTLGNLSSTVRAELDKVEEGVDQAVGAADSALSELDGITAGIDESLESTRTVRADLAAEQVIESTLERILTPRGPAPERDVLADALARDQLTAAQRAVGVASGAIDPSEFRRMRDRVHAATLGRSLERIGDICGRITGLARRAQLDAAAAGDPPPDTSSPCTLFGNPDDLQALIDADALPPPTTTSSGDDAGATTQPSADDDGPVEITEFEYVGADFDLATEFPGAYSFGGYFNPRYTYAVDGDRVSVDIVVDLHHAWVSNETRVSCWAYSTLSFTGETTLARQMVFDIEFVGQSPATLEGPTCAEFPYDADGFDTGGEPITLTVDVDDSGRLSGEAALEVEGVGLSLFAFG